jgi:HD-GYP domain-containing protein (c-di-GMP phosphodiesterase class II)
MNLRQRNVWLQVLLRASTHIDQQVSPAGRHSSRVAWWSTRIANQLKCHPIEIRQVHLAAMLHDIGKLAVPGAVLQKAGPLSDTEWQLMRLHPTIGASILYSLNDISAIAPIVITHQEKFNGSGYPRGLQGEQIPLSGRILAVADAYDAMTTQRVYRPARPACEALLELERLSGSHFDPMVVEAFINLVD